MLNKKETGKRLKEFATHNFTSLAEFGRQFGKDRTFFTPYFNGTSAPGGEILFRLAELGCDITWLLTGAKHNESVIMNQVAARMIELEKELDEKNKKLSKIRNEAGNEVHKINYHKVAEQKPIYNKKEE
jgi:transcriptional regulator with XRE-family HTH domain